MIGRRLAAWDDCRLVVIRPVIEADSKPGAACLAGGLAATRLGVVMHGGRSQVRIVGVIHRAVGEELALYPRGPSCRREKRVLQKANQLIKSRLS